MKTVRIDASKIADWASFYDSFANAFGFPQLFGRNMNAWIDCMTNLDEEFSAVQVQTGELVCVSLEDAADFKVRCPEQYQAFVECAAFVNWRRIEIGEPPILVVSFNA
ncbi:barstar family protein [Ideonella sp. YS5]|uniref:barstar family protein n=1 Tax=Ideonella sp. YS5 TaxID=3453714 RepID=UPI003EEE234A